MQQGDVNEIATIEQFYPSPWLVPPIEEELIRKAGVQLVVQDSQHHLCGWCVATQLSPEAELLKITVSLNLRRSGLGSLLLSHLEYLLHQNGITSLFLEVRSQNNSALNFYLKNGFFQVGLREKYYSLPNDDALILEKKLK